MCAHTKKIAEQGPLALAMARGEGRGTARGARSVYGNNITMEISIYGNSATCTLGWDKLFWEIPKMFLLFQFSAKNNGRVQGWDKRWGKRVWLHCNNMNRYMFVQCYNRG